MKLFSENHQIVTSSFQNRVSKRLKFAYYEQLVVKIVKSGKIRDIPSKVDIDLVVILLPQIIFYISDPIVLAIMTSEVGLKV